MNKNSLFLFVLSLTVIYGCQKEIEPKKQFIYKSNGDTVFQDILKSFVDSSRGILCLSFQHQIGSTPLTLNSPVTIGNFKYTFRQIRYWVSNVELLKADGSTYKVPDSYYLVENMERELYIGTVLTDTQYVPANRREVVTIPNIPVGSYTGIRFAIGVDSVPNSNFSLRKGELDIDKMAQVSSWVWKTSYIFLRTSGSLDSATKRYNFYFETGANTNYRTVTLNFGSNAYNALPGKTATVSIKVDLTSIFRDISLGALPHNQTLPGWSVSNYDSTYRTINAFNPDMMTKLANNYQTMFSLLNISN
ncbi:MAG: hypothetical protein NZM38_04245 [Cytophagales bacterium]|nr:hypothetical protein [Cytophagales bacterium]MDW8383962.1 hypothetical protein [Flammeovirgaceae bacterium]